MPKFEKADTIRMQLGGNRFAAMTGAKNFVALEKGLQFDLPRGMAKNKATRVQITLVSDLYSMAFYRFKRGGIEMVECGQAKHGVYANWLRTVFETETGMATAL